MAGEVHTGGVGGEEGEIELAEAVGSMRAVEWGPSAIDWGDSNWVGSVGLEGEEERMLLTMLRGFQEAWKEA